MTFSIVARIINQLLDVALLVVFARAVLAAAYPGWSGWPNDPDQGLSVWPLLGVLVALALGKAALHYLEHYAGHWVAFTALQRLRELFFARLIPQTPAATQGRAGAELTERGTRDIDRVEVFFAHTLPPAISTILVPTIALIWLGTTVNALLAVVIAMGVGLIALVVPVLSSHAAWRGARNVSHCRGAIAQHLGDDLQGVREVLSFGAQELRLRELDEVGSQLTTARMHAARIRAGRTVGISVVEATTVLVLTTVAFTADTGAAALVVALAVALGLRTPARGIDDFAVGLDAALASAARLREVIEAEPLIKDPAPKGEAGPPAARTAAVPAVEFDHVSFSYPSPNQPANVGRIIVNDVSVQIARGSWAALAGVSGSGKSTMGALLLRGWDPTAGEVRLEGAPVDTLSLNELRGRVGVVAQRPTFLTGTVREAVCLAAPEAPPELVETALEVVDLLDWVSSLPAGLDTVLRSASEVSGGQRQRLALARALVAQPEVLILDEALSQLDAQTARAVRSRLRSSWPELTVIEITHRVDVLNDDTQVTVLDAGRVLETGLVGTLRGTGSAFDRLMARVV